MSNNLSLRQQIGQRLLVGFRGESLDEEFVALVRDYKIGNVILFSRNLKSRAQMKELCGSIQSLIQRETGYGALIALDEEGGTVSRLPQDCPHMPGALKLAKSGNEALVYEAALATGRLLRELGANFNLAPVLDVNSNPLNPVIGPRSYGNTAQEVIRFSLQVIKAYSDAGILCCGKHFPGHGDTRVDSHLVLPVVDRDISMLEKAELKPFEAAIRTGIPAIMSAHILFPREDPRRPATLSSRFLTGLLRQKMGFNGLILSDCLEMKAIADNFGSCQGGIMALEAGADILCISHTAALAREIALEAEARVLSGQMDAKAMEASAGRVIAAKSML